MVLFLPESGRRQGWLPFWLLLVLVIGIVSAKHRRNGGNSGEDDDDDNDDEEEEDKFWHHVGGIIVIGVLSLVGAAMVSLCAWIVCSCHEKCCRRKVHHSNIMMVNRGKTTGVFPPPQWSRCLLIQPELCIGFGVMSDGLYSQYNGQLVRQRCGADVTDGAKWGAPLTTGKHLFEIVWPWGCRGYEATVGVATANADIKEKKPTQLVGKDSNSWGLDIVRRKIVHKGQTLANCPTDGSYVPDRFLMFVDVDEGTVGFGNDVTFWGNVITSLPRGQPLFPMIGANKWGANIQVIYKGSAGTSGFDPFIPNDQLYGMPPVPPVYPGLYEDSQPGPSPLKTAWEPMPPPTPFGEPSAPDDLPPPYASPEPRY